MIPDEYKVMGLLRELHVELEPLHEFVSTMVWDGNLLTDTHKYAAGTPARLEALLLSGLRICEILSTDDVLWQRLREHAGNAETTTPEQAA